MNPNDTGRASVRLSPPLLDALRYFAGEPGMPYPSEKYGVKLRTMGLVSKARQSGEILDGLGPVHRQVRTLTELGVSVLAEHQAAEAARARTDTPRHLQLAMPTTSANGLTTVDGVTSHLRPEGEQL